ncbi:MAG: acyl-CoA dehydrogenase family protein [Actinomycetota bacterium]|nr:acyl-CoA dehydrogenase family protein [Actinomycetota bacterium]
MTGTTDAGAAGDLRTLTRTALEALLSPRGAHHRGTVMGAGSDDFESGRRFLTALAEGGWAVPTWPVEHGGMGLSSGEADVIAAVLDDFETPDMYPFLVGLDLIGPTILAHGSDEQKSRWLPAMRSGEEIWCQMFSEPDAGSDLANLKAGAVRDDDGWRVSGSKVWTSRAHYSQWGLLLARTDVSVPKHAGITAFGVDLSAPGATVRPLIQMNGDSHFNEVFLDEVVIPDADRIGAVGEGWRVAITCLSFERGSLAGDLGVTGDEILALLDDAVRTAPGATIGNGDRAPGAAAIHRDRVLRSYTDLRIGQWTALRSQAARAAGRPPGPLDSGAKLTTNRMIRALADRAVEIAGPAATVVGDSPSPWQTMFLVSPSLSIRGGTDEIQHNILGERVLGLPPEPRVDKNKPFSDRPDA